MSETFIGRIGVDSGQMMLVDPCYVRDWVDTPNLSLNNNGSHYDGEFSYGGACAATLSDKQAGILGEFGSAAVCATGFGDGAYAVYVTYSDQGAWGKRISEMRIVFIGDDEDDDDEVCFYCTSEYCDGECEDESDD